MGHVVDIAVNGDGLGDERVIADVCDIVKHGLPLVLDGQPTHTAICVVDDEELLCAKKFAAHGRWHRRWRVYRRCESRGRRTRPSQRILRDRGAHPPSKNGGTSRGHPGTLDLLYVRVPIEFPETPWRGGPPFRSSWRA